LPPSIVIDHPAMVGRAATNWLQKSAAIDALMKKQRILNTLALTSRSASCSPISWHSTLTNSGGRNSSVDRAHGWPGSALLWKSNPSFNSHEALFVDKEDDDGVFPRLVPGITLFYAANVTYDMTRQWIANEGPFAYDYRWLSSTCTAAEFKDFADRNFEQLYGIHPDKFEIV
jgi:hypothetical protein